MVGSGYDNQYDESYCATIQKYADALLLNRAGSASFKTALVSGHLSDIIKSLGSSRIDALTFEKARTAVVKAAGFYHEGEKLMVLEYKGLLETYKDKYRYNKTCFNDMLSVLQAYVSPEIGSKLFEDGHFGSRMMARLENKRFKTSLDQTIFTTIRVVADLVAISQDYPRHLEAILHVSEMMKKRLFSTIPGSVFAGYIRLLANSSYTGFPPEYSRAVEKVKVFDTVLQQFPKYIQYPTVLDEMCLLIIRYFNSYNLQRPYLLLQICYKPISDRLRTLCSLETQSFYLLALAITAKHDVISLSQLDNPLTDISIDEPFWSNQTLENLSQVLLILVTLPIAHSSKLLNTLCRAVLLKLWHLEHDRLDLLTNHVSNYNLDLDGLFDPLISSLGQRILSCRKSLEKVIRLAKLSDFLKSRPSRVLVSFSWEKIFEKALSSNNDNDGLWTLLSYIVPALSRTDISKLENTIEQGNDGASRLLAACVSVEPETILVVQTRIITKFLPGKSTITNEALLLVEGALRSLKRDYFLDLFNDHGIGRALHSSSQNMELKMAFNMVILVTSFYLHSDMFRNSVLDTETIRNLGDIGVQKPFWVQDLDLYCGLFLKVKLHRSAITETKWWDDWVRTFVTVADSRGRSVLVERLEGSKNDRDKSKHSGRREAALRKFSPLIDREKEDLEYERRAALKKGGI